MSSSSHDPNNLVERPPSSRHAEVVELPNHFATYVDRWAIVIGISKYQHKDWNLKYADCDAEDLYKLLLTPNGGSFATERICKLTNEYATTGNITRALRGFLKKPAREDLVLIYFACHGSPDPDRPENVYLLTYDTDPTDIAGTALPMEDIDRALTSILHSEKVIILADTCHSGALGGGIGGRRSVVNDAKLMNRFLQDISQSKGGVALLTSAESNEISLEDAKWGGGHGVFTHYLLEGMRGSGDLDGNGIVTVGELFEYVRDNVKRETNNRQHPAIGTNAYDRNLPIAILDSSLLPKEPISSNSFPIQDALQHNQTLDDDLRSDWGMDYTMLRNLLVAQRWKEADEETESNLHLLLKWEGIDGLPCIDLWTIDQLWSKYSNQRFGLKMQHFIWQSLSKEVDQVHWKKFCQQVGWLAQFAQQEDEISQSSDSVQLMPISEIRISLNIKPLLIMPEGHLPSFIYSNKDDSILKAKCFFNRLEECRI